MKKVVTTLLGLIVAIHVMLGCTTSTSEDPLDKAENSQISSRLSKEERDKVFNLFNNNQWDQAIKYLINYTSSYPDNGEGWFLLGSAYHGKKDYSRAIEANHKSIEVSNQMRASAYYNLACAYALTKNLDEAEKSLKQAMQNGFLDYDLLRKDKDIELLRKAGLIALPESQNYQRIVHHGIVVDYHIILPENYDPSKSYPAMLAYPPGSQEVSTANWAISTFWGAAAKSKGWIIVVPVAPKNGWINHPSHHALNDLLKTVKEMYKIEGGKFHMVGFESGARPAATFALMSKQYFQSLTTVSGYSWDRWDTKSLESFKIMPVKMIVGGADPYGLEINKQVQILFDKYKVRNDLEIIPNESRHLPGLWNAVLIDKIDDFVR